MSVEGAIEKITSSFKSKPKTVEEAMVLLEHIALKHIEPLIDGIRAWALSDIDEEHKKIAEEAIATAEKDFVKSA